MENANLSFDSLYQILHQSDPITAIKLLSTSADLWFDEKIWRDLFRRDLSHQVPVNPREQYIDYFRTIKKQDANQQLLTATKLGYEVAVQHLVESWKSGTYLNLEDALDQAVIYDHLNLVEYFANQLGAVNSLILGLVAQYGRINIAEYLLQTFPKLNTSRLMQIAAFDGQTEFIQFLLSRGARLELEDIRPAIMKDQLATVKFILNYLQIQPTEQMLDWALNNNAVNVAAYFYSLGMRAQAPFNNITEAVSNRNTDVLGTLSFLMQHENIPTSFLRRLMQRAIYYNQLPIIEYLLAHGIPMPTDPLERAISDRNIDLVKLYVKYGANITDADIALADRLNLPAISEYLRDNI